MLSSKIDVYFAQPELTASSNHLMGIRLLASAIAHSKILRQYSIKINATRCCYKNMLVYTVIFSIALVSQPTIPLAKNNKYT